MVMSVVSTLLAPFVRGTPADPTALTLADQAFARRETSLDRDRAYEHFANYYQGMHRDPRRLLTDPLETSVGANAGDYNWAPRHNAMAKVIDTKTDRLQVQGFVVGESVRATLDDVIAQWWRAGRMDETQGTVHAQAQIKGDAYLIVRYDPLYGRPCWVYRDALNMLPVYDEGTQEMLACYQTWTETRYAENGTAQTVTRLVIYRPDSITKWYSLNGVGWRLWTLDVDTAGRPDGGVIVWRDVRGQPLGIPVVHFRNRPRGATFGRSDLADLIPLQDEYNRRAWATSQSAALEGNMTKYLIDAAGVEPADDPTEVPDAAEATYVSGPDKVWLIYSRGDKQAAAGHFPAGNTAQLQDVADRELKTIATLSNVPVHLIWPEGSLPSGESLRVAEAPLIADCRAKSVSYGDAWEDAIRLAIRLANRFGVARLPDPATFTIDVEWSAFETRSAVTDADYVVKVGDRLGQRESLRVLGYNDEEVDRIVAEKAKDAPTVAASPIGMPARQGEEAP